MRPFRIAYRTSMVRSCMFSFSMMWARCVWTVFTLMAIVGLAALPGLQALEVIRHDGFWQNAQQSVQGIVGAPGQDRRDARCGLSFLQEDEPGHVQGHQLNGATGAASVDFQLGHDSFDLLPEVAGARIQAGHQEGSLLPDVCYVLDTQSFRQAVSLYIFTDRSWA